MTDFGKSDPLKDGHIRCSEPKCEEEITVTVRPDGKLLVTCLKGHESVVTQPNLKKP
jgi:hypothetical protein